MRERYRLGLGLALVLQLALLGWMIADRAMLLKNGAEIRLAVVPVDPRDLFRGDFVILSYDISRIASNAVTGDDSFTYQDPIYVTIAQGTEGWRATAIDHTAPEGAAPGTVLRGTVMDLDAGGACTDVKDCWVYAIDYNIEQFFIPEAAGGELDKLRNEKRVSVDVAVSADGRAALKRLLVDGVPRYEEPLF